MEPDETLHVDKAEYEQLQRDANHRCGPHLCSHSRRWKVVALVCVAVMVGLMLDKLYREDIRNKKFQAAVLDAVNTTVKNRLTDFQRVVQTAVAQMVDAAFPEEVLRELTKLRDQLSRQVWAAQTPDQDRDLELLRRVEALERQ